MKRIAVVGAGGMARVRGKALLSTGMVQITGIASRRASSAEALGQEFGCPACYDDYHKLLDTGPEAVLVEVPHSIQDEIVLWAMESGLHVLLGSPLATSVSMAQRVISESESRGLVVEAGFEARYSGPWTTAKSLIENGGLGALVAVRSIALWDGDPETWYYSQEISAGMPLTHMTYCFINPVRWILGDPVLVSAFANRKHRIHPELVTEEMCVASMLFPDDTPYSMTAGFVRPGQLPSWSITFIGTKGAVELYEVEHEIDHAAIYIGTSVEHRDFSTTESGFQAQAWAFLNAIDGHERCRNTPRDTIGDIRAVEAIVAAAKSRSVVAVPGDVR